ncbi:hypothetical protein [Heyndrickxia vini]|uniref:Uncharacterized protein n=1 Tax=Heyndrickxia vini TaxID=1476025 RepID=A0ABX7DZ38_9BACI|nr:hypothetical protein [Heyndrickxia vini]QQZ08601.1 hypothetical protein I5776_16385 [Heyndrickxia vini]
MTFHLITDEMSSFLLPQNEKGKKRKFFSGLERSDEEAHRQPRGKRVPAAERNGPVLTTTYMNRFNEIQRD